MADALLDFMLSVMIETDNIPLIDAAGELENRLRSSYIRNLIVTDLKAKGLLDEYAKPSDKGRHIIDAYEWPESRPRRKEGQK